MKKIYIVNIGTEIGGIEKCLINFLKYLENKDCEVDLALWKRNGPLYDEIPGFVNVLPSPGPGSFSKIIKEKNIKKLIIKTVKYVKFKLYCRLGYAWKSVPKSKKQYDIAISYCQNGYSPYYVIDNIKADRKYLWYHELNYSGADKAKDAQYFSKYDNIICVSEACRNNMKKAFPEISQKFITLYNFYDFDEIISKSNETDNPFDGINKKILLTVGRLSKEKGVELAVRSCKELLKYTKDFVWVWIGDGPEKIYAENMIKEYGVENNISFWGNKTNPYPFIKNCDLYVQPSLSEAFCTTVIEAQVLGKPIVATNVDSIYEQLSETEFSVIVEKNPEKLAKGIYDILNRGLKSDVDYPLDKYNCVKQYDNLLFGKK